MLDEHAGKAGTFIVDPDKGVRVPIEQWQAELAMKAEAAKAKAKNQTQTTEYEHPEAK